VSLWARAFAHRPARPSPPPRGRRSPPSRRSPRTVDRAATTQATQATQAITTTLTTTMAITTMQTTTTATTVTVPTVVCQVVATARSTVTRPQSCTTKRDLKSVRAEIEPMLSRADVRSDTSKPQAGAGADGACSCTAYPRSLTGAVERKKKEKRKKEK